MFGFGKKQRHQEIQPGELQAMLAAGRAVVVDVREPGEFAAGHIAGSINLPLSGFSPVSVPAAPDKTIILLCAAGSRSSMALDRCAAAQVAIGTHLAGGLRSWMAAGFPLTRG